MTNEVQDTLTSAEMLHGRWTAGWAQLVRRGSPAGAAVVIFSCLAHVGKRLRVIPLKVVVHGIKRFGLNRCSLIGYVVSKTMSVSM